jgi:ribosomal protein L16 Arg81 hydroxylase
MTYDIDETLATLIAPMTPDEFFADYYNRRTLVVRGQRDKFDRFFASDMWRTQPMTDVSAVQDVSIDGVAASKAVSIAPTAVTEQYEAGKLVVGRVDHLPQIGELMDGLRASLQFPSGKNSFVDKVLCFTSKDDAGYRVHWDVHHNFILQIDGRKRWRYSLFPAVEAPTEGAFVGATGAPAAIYGNQVITTPDIDTLEEVTLEPGDFLYMPPGVWHAPRAVGHTVHLSVAMGHRPIFKLIVDVLKVEFGRKLAWRSGFPRILGQARTSGEVPTDIKALFRRCIDELRDDLANIDTRVFEREWCAEVGEHHFRASTRAPAPVGRYDVLRRSTAVPIRYCVAPSEDHAGEDDVYIYTGDRKHIALPEATLGFVRQLALAPQFVAEHALNWDPDFAWNEISQVLTQLVACGILRIADGPREDASSPMSSAHTTPAGALTASS